MSLTKDFTLWVFLLTRQGFDLQRTVLGAAVWRAVEVTETQLWAVTTSEVAKYNLVRTASYDKAFAMWAYCMFPELLRSKHRNI